MTDGVSLEQLETESPPGFFPRWALLWLAPAEFICGPGRRAGLFVPIVLAGMAGAFDRLESQALVGRAVAISEGWAPILLFALLISPIVGAIGYFIGGIWNQMRLSFCGVRESEAEFCRRVSVLTSVIVAVPVVLTWLGHAIRYDAPRDYFATDSVFLTPVLLGLWSSWATYASFKREYALEGRAPAFWFLVIPLGATGVTVVGVAVYTYSLTSGL